MCIRDRFRAETTTIPVWDEDNPVTRTPAVVLLVMIPLPVSAAAVAEMGMDEDEREGIRFHASELSIRTHTLLLWWDDDPPI